jgi:hypothetical protein
MADQVITVPAQNDGLMGGVSEVEPAQRTIIVVP